MACPFLTLIKKQIQHCYIFNMVKQRYLFAKSKTKNISLYPQWSFFCLFVGLSYCSSNLLAFCILFLHHTTFSWIICDIGVWNWCAKLVWYAHHSRYRRELRRPLNITPNGILNQTVYPCLKIMMSWSYKMHVFQQDSRFTTCWKLGWDQLCKIYSKISYKINIFSETWKVVKH